MTKKYRQIHILENLELRSKVLRSIRSFFEDLNFLEVETPIRIPTPIPEVNIDAQESGKWFLNTSPELCMKRLLAAGYRKIFQLCKCFRKDERGNFHLPEMTLLEWYEIDSDYNTMMIQCEELLKYIALQLGCKDCVTYKGNLIDLSSPWDKITVEEAFNQYASIDVESALALDKFDETMCFEIEPNLGKDKPIFLYDYPVSLGALAAISSNNLKVVERFELYCSGIELCNAFTELNNSYEQRVRFELELERRMKIGKSTYPLPEKFLNALDDMPRASGNAMGIDRLVMFFANAENIDQVVAFIPEEL